MGADVVVLEIGVLQVAVRSNSSLAFPYTSERYRTSGHAVPWTWFPRRIRPTRSADSGVARGRDRRFALHHHFGGVAAALER